MEKELKLIKEQWGVDVPSLRIKANSPTFGSIVLFFFEKSATRTYFGLWTNVIYIQYVVLN
jgi:hypothetical protein